MLLRPVGIPGGFFVFNLALLPGRVAVPRSNQLRFAGYEIPVGIWNGECKVDFKKVYDKISFMLKNRLKNSYKIELTQNYTVGIIIYILIVLIMC